MHTLWSRTPATKFVAEVCGLIAEDGGTNEVYSTPWQQVMLHRLYD